MREVETQSIAFEGLAWSVALEADITPSVASLAVEMLIERVRQALDNHASTGVAGVGSIEPTVRGMNDDGVVAALVRADPPAEGNLVWALACDADVTPSNARLVIDVLGATIGRRLRRYQHVEIAPVCVVEAADEGPYNDDLLALVARPHEEATAWHCPVCQSNVRRFLPFRGAATSRRTGALCARCGSLERHRMIWRFFVERTDLFEPPVKRVLHVAPEPGLGRRLEEHPMIDYLSVDLEMPSAVMQMDITDMSFPDATFDVVYCSHVLEHIPNDRTAMAELFRVLKPGGWAILQVPILRKRTEEDPSVDTPEERSKRFGQSDHVRAYGPDYRDRLSAVGFDVTVDDFAKHLDRRFGPDPSELVYYCAKPVGAPARA